MFKQYIESSRETLEYLKNYRKTAKIIKDIVGRKYKNAKVHVSGSVLAGSYTALSDIDILVVSNEISSEEAVELKVQILRGFGFPAPLEIHIVTEKQFRDGDTIYLLTALDGG